MLESTNIIPPVAHLGLGGFVCGTVNVYEQEHLVEQTALPNSMGLLYKIK